MFTQYFIIVAITTMAQTRQSFDRSKSLTFYNKYLVHRNSPNVKSSVEILWRGDVIISVLTLRFSYRKSLWQKNSIFLKRVYYEKIKNGLYITMSGADLETWDKVSTSMWRSANHWKFHWYFIDNTPHRLAVLTSKSVTTFWVTMHRLIYLYRINFRWQLFSVNWKADLLRN